MRISDWSSDVCSSDLLQHLDSGIARDQRSKIIGEAGGAFGLVRKPVGEIGRAVGDALRAHRFAAKSRNLIQYQPRDFDRGLILRLRGREQERGVAARVEQAAGAVAQPALDSDFLRQPALRSEEHTSELQSLM